MGAWGVGIFENDMALDWVIELEQSDSSSVIQAALDGVNLAEDYVDADEGAWALAAADVVAALIGNPATALLDEVRNWVSNHSDIDARPLISQATQAASTVQSSPESELRELWEETDEIDAWNDTIADLLRRLR